MRQVTFTSLGDCCIDHFVCQKKRFLGGTAFNVAYHAAKAGATTSLISSVGSDIYGMYYYDSCSRNNVNVTFFSTRIGSTSSVDIILDKANSPTYANWDIGVLKRRILTQKEKEFLKTQNIARAVLFKPVSAMFDSFCKLPLRQTIKVGDFLGVSDYSYRTSPIERYAKHLDILIKSIEEKHDESLAFLHFVAQKYNKIIVALLGEDGSIVFTKKQTYTQPAMKTTAVNTTGAGDTYQAYFAYWYVRTHNIQKAMQEATKAAAETIQHLGAADSQEITAG